MGDFAGTNEPNSTTPERQDAEGHDPTHAPGGEDEEKEQEQDRDEDKQEKATNEPNVISLFNALLPKG